jgi:hypothetical protein
VEESIGADLQAEDPDEWPFAVVLDRSLCTCFTSKLLPNHALVAALTDAVPLLPSQVQRFLEELFMGRIECLFRKNVALQINVHREVAAVVALPIYASCLLTALYTCPKARPLHPHPYQQSLSRDHRK